LLILGLAWLFAAPSCRAAAATYHGDSLLARGDAQGAVVAYQRALELDQRCWRAQVRQATALARLGRSEVALQRLEQALRERPDQPEVLQRAARFFVEQSMVGPARQVLRHELSLEPGNFEALLRMASLSLQLEEPRAAQLWFGKILEQNPYYFDARIKLAMVEQRSEPRKAIESYQSLLGYGPPPACKRRALLGLFEVALRLGERAEAERRYHALLAFFPGSPETNLARAQLQVAP
jgi:tetratricopeptide (TPR) repeat protein